MTDRTGSAHLRSLDQPLPPAAGVLLSALFWLLLLFTTMLFAILVLGPRLLAWQELYDRYAANRSDLQCLEVTIRDLEQMAFALEHDQAYAQRVVLEELGPAPAIDVLRALTTGIGSSAATASEPPAGNRDWPVGAIRSVSVPGSRRTQLICIACLVCLLAFACLHEGALQSSLGRPVRSIGRWFARRYTRQS